MSEPRDPAPASPVRAADLAIDPEAGSPPDASGLSDAGLGWRKRLLFRFMSWWPPMLGAGIRVRRIGPGLTAFETEMRLHPWNRNYVGTQYGGSLYSMADPFFMLLLIERLGPGYVVWDKEASIRFRRPGRSTVRARFEITGAEVDRIRREAQRSPKVEPVFLALVLDESGEVVAEIEKVLHVRRRQPQTPPPAARRTLP